MSAKRGIAKTQSSAAAAAERSRTVLEAKAAQIARDRAAREARAAEQIRQASAAAAQPLPARPAVLTATKPMTAAPVTSMATQDWVEVIEPNPFDRFPTDEGWTTPIQIYKGAFLQYSKINLAGTRANACSAVQSKRSQYVAQEEAKGFITGESVSDCICQTSPRKRSLTPSATRGWTCLAYWIPHDTGKKQTRAISS